jgi:hypothetical protein
LDALEVAATRMDLEFADGDITEAFHEVCFFGLLQSLK